MGLIVLSCVWFKSCRDGQPHHAHSTHPPVGHFCCARWGAPSTAPLPTIRDVVARVGVADVRAFGLTWEDCEQLLTQLGYSAQVSIVAR
jgi:hypothetical protein